MRLSASYRKCHRTSSAGAPDTGPQLPCAVHVAVHSASACRVASDGPACRSHQREPLWTPTAEHHEYASNPKFGRRELLLHATSACALAIGAEATLAAGARAASLVDEDVAVSVYRIVAPSVASIAVVRTVGGAPLREVVGSGIVWDGVGPHVITNFHILPPLQGSSTLLQVTLTDAATGAAVTTGARVAGSDSLHDLAVLRLLPLDSGAPEQGPAQQQQQAEVKLARDGGAAPAAADDSHSGASLPSVAPIRLGTSADLRVGQSVFALGCVASQPTAPSTSLTAGLVSGLDRSIPSPVGARIYGVVQTDALINAANSGGALVDTVGRLVGLCTAVGSARAGAVRGSGVYFALPADLLRDLVPKIIVYGNPYGKK